MTEFIIEPILPERFDFQPVIDEIKVEMDVFANSISQDFGSVISTWRGPPGIAQEDQSTPDDLVTIIGPEGANADKFKWLDEGTNERWAVMGAGFRPKTRPNSLSVGSGSPPFEPVRRGRSQMEFPRPGIEPRNFSNLIARKHRLKFRKAIVDAVTRGLNKGIK